MKKIMFNDKYGLTEAVLEKRKTMTRRIIPIELYNQTDWKAVSDGDYEAVVDGEGYYHDIRQCGQYQIGEEVAVAQKYKDVLRIANKDESVWQFLVKKDLLQSGGAVNTEFCSCAGWSNKMFVRADLMPHRIRITNIRLERLQDISDEDCMEEGVEKWMDCYIVTGIMYRDGKSNVCFDTPHEAFAALIDKLSGNGTWERNPWVFVYEFELVK